MTVETTRLKILIVEDEESLADSVRYNLEREGFAVAIAPDGRRSLERFRADDPALVVVEEARGILNLVSDFDFLRSVSGAGDVDLDVAVAVRSAVGRAPNTGRDCRGTV